MMRRKRWLWRYLWGWTLLVLWLTWTCLAAVAYITGLHEARLITDRHLQATADILLRVKELGTVNPVTADPPIPALESRPSRRVSDLCVVAWEDGRLTWDTHHMADLLPSHLDNGWAVLTLASDGPDARPRQWRVYAMSHEGLSGTQRQVVVLKDTARHRALAIDMTLELIQPAIVLFPLSALLLIWAIRRGLRPLNQLSADMAALDVRAGQRLEGQQAFMELDSTVAAIHHLVDQLQHQWARERQFNADVAHELRTPLTSAVLQAHLAQSAEHASEREQALKRVEMEALRAAGILSQLLELARAQRPDRMTSATVDLCELARHVCAQHLGLAHEGGQALALEAPDTPIRVNGHPELLRLALRNLVDNALRHNPRGTQVEIAVHQAKGGEVSLSVNDDGHFDPGGSSRQGMGVGLTLVRRIADALGVRFQHEPGQPPFRTRFVLTWPRPTATD